MNRDEKRQRLPQQNGGAFVPKKLTEEVVNVFKCMEKMNKS